MKTRLLALLLAFCLFVGVLPAAARAEDATSGSCGENATWSFDAETGTLTISGSGEMDNYAYYDPTAPWKPLNEQVLAVVIEDGITSVGNYAFAYFRDLLSVTLPQSVTHIGAWAFANAVNAVFTFSNGLITIGESAFICCNSITEIPEFEQLTTIGKGAFSGCQGLTSITIPASLTTLGDQAFAGCDNVTDVWIPAGLINIGETPFFGCSKLRGIWVDAANPAYSNDSRGVLFNKDKTTLFTIPYTMTGMYEIPYGVTTIGYRSFSCCTEDLIAVVIPETVTRIEMSAFIETGVQKIYFKGDAPFMDHPIFEVCYPDVYYPAGNSTWTRDIVTSYEFGIDWIPYTQGTDPWAKPFTDVPQSKYYYAPVMWAYSYGITTGTTATTFAPDRECTRGQIVTFLWRAAGQPEPTTTNNPFTDVDSDDFYYKAVLWAVEKGITNGASPTTFNPKGACSRAEVVTFMWRAAGKPAPTSANNPFVDVPEGKYYHDAVLWAVELEITNGTNATKFSPNNICNRGQIATFLYRAYANP